MPVPQQAFETIDHFARSQIQTSAQMALHMVSLKRTESGEWSARKGIPKDVRVAYAKAHGVRWEAVLKLPAATTPALAKARLGEWLAEVETRIEQIRATAIGTGQPLTALQALGLAGRWYVWFISEHLSDLNPAFLKTGDEVKVTCEAVQAGNDQFGPGSLRVADGCLELGTGIAFAAFHLNVFSDQLPLTSVQEAQDRFPLRLKPLLPCLSVETLRYETKEVTAKAACPVPDRRNER